jgi:hypothetical protein
MHSPERRAFDRGFALKYPENNGLVESLEGADDKVRTIVQDISQLDQDQNAVFALLRTNPNLTFNFSDEGNRRTYAVPLDSRDLSSYIRLSSANNQPKLGEIFGRKLRQIYETTGGLVPITNIVERFAVHSTQQSPHEPYPSREGVDVKLLPPFTDFGFINDKNKIIVLVEQELQDNLGDQHDKFVNFLEGVQSGLDSVG